MFYNSTYLHHAMSHADHVTKNALWIRDKDYTWYSVVWSKLYFTFHYIHIFVMSLYVHMNAIRWMIYILQCHVFYSCSVAQYERVTSKQAWQADHQHIKLLAPEHNELLC